MSATPSFRERLARPAALSKRDYLNLNLIIGTIVQVIVAALIAGLAVSRASHHRLSAVALAGILIGDAGLNGAFRATLNYNLGAAEAAEGRVIHAAAVEDSARPFWRRCLVWSACAGLWGVALALIAVAALNHRTAGYPVVFVGLLVAGGGSAGPLSLVARGDGVRMAMSPPGEPRPLRRRAWREIALPIGSVFAATNVAIGWVLFHDYTQHAAFATHALTRTEAYADTLILLVIVGLLSALTAGAAGRAEGRTGRILLEDPARETPSEKAPFGRQAYGYTIVATLVVVGTVVRIVTPELPSLWQVLVARGVLSGVVATIASGFAFVRGATNALVLPIPFPLQEVPV